MDMGRSRRMSIGDEEDGDVIELPIDLNTNMDAGSLKLVGRVCAEKMINKDTFLIMMQNLWRPCRGMEGVSLRHNLFMFTF